MEINIVRNYVFIAILLRASGQDLRKKSISLYFLLSSGGIGAALGLFQKRSLQEVLLSCGIGGLLLGISKVTRGGIGEGDGWFFVVTGMYLEWKENLILLLTGLLLCSLVSLSIVAGGVWKKERPQRRTLPFLPFLLPFGIWSFLSKTGLL